MRVRAHLLAGLDAYRVEKSQMNTLNQCQIKVAITNRLNTHSSDSPSLCMARTRFKPAKK